LIGLVIGWAGISDTVNLNHQTRWLGLGIAALIFAGFGMVGWLLVGLREGALLRNDVMAELDRRYPVEAGQPEPARGQDYGTVNGMRHYHRDGCQMLLGKTVRYADAATHASAGLSACLICVDAGSAPVPTAAGHTPEVVGRDHA